MFPKFVDNPLFCIVADIICIGCFMYTLCIDVAMYTDEKAGRWTVLHPRVDAPSVGVTDVTGNIDA